MGVVGLWGILIGSFAILSASVSSKSSPPEYSAADGEASALVLEVERLNKQTARPKGKLEDVEVSVGEEVTEGVTTENVSTAPIVNATAWALEASVSYLTYPLIIVVTKSNTPTTLPVNNHTWELGGQTAFNASQAMGGWHWIEVFLSDGRHSPNPCEEFIFNLSGSTGEVTWRWGNPGNKDEVKADLTVDTLAPHQWPSEGGLTWTWAKTDYANGAVLLWCYDKSCEIFVILSRERTLPPATLEMLKNVAEQRGFPKSHGVLVDQTSC